MSVHIRYNNDPFPGQDSHPIPDDWQRDIEWAAMKANPDGTRWIGPTHYRREHAERDAAQRPGAGVVSRQIHAGPWMEHVR